jgi:hypothetical protein
MALDEGQKEILRQRLDKARLAKIEKKTKITNLTEVVNTLPEKPVIVEKIPDKPVEEKITEVSHVKEVKNNDKLPSSEKHTKIMIENKKESREKYAKLVFYKEPSKKSLEKLTKAMNDESDEEVVSTPSVLQQQAKPPQIDERQQRMNALSNMSLKFFQ